MSFNSIFGWLGEEGCLDNSENTVAEPREKPEGVLRVDVKQFAESVGASKDNNASNLDIGPTLIDEINEIGKSKIVLPPDFDIWAWYQPIHFYGEAWGIYIKEEALKTISSRVWNSLSIMAKTNAEIPQCIFSAYAILHLHEEYHHRVESFSIRSHIFLGSCTYLKYERDVFGKTRWSNPLFCREEALCHAFARRALQSRLRVVVSKEVLTAAIRVMDEIIQDSTGPYAAAELLLQDDNFIADQSHLQSQIQEGVINPSRSSHPWQIDKCFFDPIVSRSHIPTYLVPAAQPRIYLPGILEFTAPRRGIVKLLRDYGYSETEEGKGSHVKFKKPGSPMIILPKGRDISPEVVNSIAKSLKLSQQELASVARSLA